MKIFKDVFSGDELFSDSYKVKLVDECLYEVYGKHVTRTDGDIVLDGANASAEEESEANASSSQSGVDIVLNHRLVETGFGSKKDYTACLKEYMKKVVKYLEENDRSAEVSSFKENINNVMKGLIGKFKDLQFFTGESMEPDAMIVLLEYKEVDGVEKPCLYFFKHGLLEEKF